MLLVQPGFEQKRKQFDDPRQNFLSTRAQTMAALAARAERGEDPPDLVCWGESMLYLLLVEDGVAEAVRRGVQPPPWQGEVTLRDLERLAQLETEWVAGSLFGDWTGGGRRFASDAAAFPAGTSFLCGAETLDVVGDELRRRNALVLFGPDARRSRGAAKRFLVPGAETMLGLERFEAVREIVFEVAAYIPDFVAAEGPNVLTLETREGERFRFVAAVCFDNAFDSLFVDACASGAVDFHFVASNEAWYETSCEMDQMVAFSRLIAVATGRAMVRATNSGVSLVLGPDGAELGRVRAGGVDRAVDGDLSARVPVPASGAGNTPYVALRTWLRLFAVLAGPLLVVFSRSGARLSSASE